MFKSALTYTVPKTSLGFTSVFSNMKFNNLFKKKSQDIEEEKAADIR
jgi:hypothetical protein